MTGHVCVIVSENIRQDIKQHRVLFPQVAPSVLLRMAQGAPASVHPPRVLRPVPVDAEEDGGGDSQVLPFIGHGVRARRPDVGLQGMVVGHGDVVAGGGLQAIGVYSVGELVD